MDTETKINEIIDFHDKLENYKAYEPWFTLFYSNLREAGACEDEGIDISLLKLTPAQISSIHASMPRE